jgi:hypothetical protein
VTQHQSWQRNVETATHNAVAIRQRQALIADIESRFNLPPPPPEPGVVYVEAVEGSDQLGTSDFNPKPAFVVLRYCRAGRAAR